MNGERERELLQDGPETGPFTERVHQHYICSAVFRYVTTCRLVDSYRWLGKNHFRPEDDGCTFPRNIGKHQPDCTASYTTRHTHRRTRA